MEQKHVSSNNEAVHRAESIVSFDSLNATLHLSCQ